MSNLRRLATDYANNKLDYQDYRAQRTGLIDHLIENTDPPINLIPIKANKIYNLVKTHEKKGLGKWKLILLVFILILTSIFIFQESIILLIDALFFHFLQNPIILDN